jgi:hypothetical protein
MVRFLTQGLRQLLLRVSVQIRKWTIIPIEEGLTIMDRWTSDLASHFRISLPRLGAFPITGFNEILVY